ncbi:MAG: tetratricopeptide repeat protein [Planctomycetes bacterium]|nr:tetratricopeptide repeat protein [Planctomycetota bacterium]
MRTRKSIPAALFAVTTLALVSCATPHSGVEAEKVRMLTRAERLDDAISAGRSAAKNDPQDAQLKIALGEAYLAANRIDDAVDVLTDATQLAPKDPVAQADLGVARYQKALDMIDSSAQATVVGGLFNDAASSLEKSLALDAKNADARFCLALVRFQQFRFDDARAELEKVLVQRPNDALVLFKLGEVAAADDRMADAANAYRRAVTALPGYEEASQRLAEILAASGDAAGAGKALEDALRVNPNSEPLYNQLWELYARDKRWDDLVAAYDRVASAQPGNAKVQWYRGSALATKGDEKGTLESFEKCIVLDPTLPMPYVELARIEAKNGKLDAAITHLRRAREIERSSDVSSDESPAIDSLSRLAIQMFGGGRQDEAIALVKEFAEREGDNPFLWSNLGLFYRDSGHYEESFAAYQKAAELAPNDGQILNDAGVVLDYHLDRPKEAVEYYNRAIAASDHDETYGNLVRRYVVWKDFDKALEVGEKGLALYPDNEFIKRWVDVAKQAKAGVNVDDMFAIGGSSGGGGPALRGAPKIEDVAKELKLEGDKKDKVGAILDGYNKDLLDAYQQEQGNRNWQEFQTKTATLRQSLETKLGEVLTEDELKAYLAKWPTTRSGGTRRPRQSTDGH